MKRQQRRAGVRIRHADDAGEVRRPAPETAPHVLIVGSGFAGFHCARELERVLAPGEARVTMASPTDYMLYSPLLPQVAAGILAPADISVSLRRAFRHTLRAPCSIVGADPAAKVCVARTTAGQEHAVRWDRLVLCPGAVTRTFSIPGLTRYGRGLKTLAEARYLHDHVLAQLELANMTADAAARAAHCTFIVVGAGYAGTETAATLQAFTHRALRRFINLRPGDVRWILIDVAPRVLPELGDKLGDVALRVLRDRGIEVWLDTGVNEVSADRVELSDGRRIGCHTLIWTAGVAASPLLGVLGLETVRAGRLAVTATMQTPQEPEVFAAGDCAAVPDVTKPDGTVTPPTAQHAQRQGIALARNVVRSLRGHPTLPYRHSDLGLVVDLGGTRSVARPLGRELTGLPAQVVTRGYHLSAIPSGRSRSKAAVSWLAHTMLGDDLVQSGLCDAVDPTLETVARRVEYLDRRAVHDVAGTLPSTPT